MNKAIGGYFGLELGKPTDSNPHISACAVNSGRNALYCILETLKPTKLLVPRLFCDVILEPIRKLDIHFEFYSITESFQPKIDFLEKGTILFYINYFGVCDSCVAKLVAKYPNQLIVDNSQAFFSTPHQGIPTFYSARKFFGVPDGAYFYGVDYDLSQLPQGTSWNRCSHLFKRIDISPEEGYQDFVQNEKYFSSLPYARISKFTSLLFATIDFTQVYKKRLANFNNLHKYLHSDNLFSRDFTCPISPISYPYQTDGAVDIRQYLIDNRVFVPVFWPESQEEQANDSNLNEFAHNILHLPIDQRYSGEDMSRIINLIRDVK
ncbi:MAG: hypothetical protein KAR44_05890 [Candidatus Aegiribacteria sp.]|nr:hypothetical protein [Candidatus Aegiribacteria sp.]